MRTMSEAMDAFSPNKCDQTQQQRILHIENSCKELLKDIYDMVPESADRTAGVRKLLEAKMTFVQAISHPPKEEQQSNAKADQKKSK